jgi:hypothetical protein
MAQDLTAMKNPNSVSAFKPTELGEVAKETS